MHYRQTILDAVVAALNAVPELLGTTTSTRFYPEVVDDTAPRIRVQVVEETVDEPQLVMDDSNAPRILTFRVTLYLGGDDVQRSADTYLEFIEGTVPAALEPVTDCGYYLRQTWAIEAEQDRETIAVGTDYICWYVTTLDDPSIRV